jgi:hypothetical protein
MDGCGSLGICILGSSMALSGGVVWKRNAIERESTVLT